MGPEPHVSPACERVEGSRPEAPPKGSWKNYSTNFGVTSIRCPLLAGLSVHKTSGDRHSEERNEEINDIHDIHDSVRR
jgi:hypothetical protein